MTALSDYTRWMLYFPECLNTKQALWFVRDVADVEALAGIGVNAAMCNAKNFSKCRDFFAAFPSVFVAVGDAGIAAEIAEELESRCNNLVITTPKPGAFGKFQFVREVLEAGGPNRVNHLMLGAVERPMDGILDLSQVKRENLRGIPAAMSTIPEINRELGGFYAGELCVWTGKRGEGKSTKVGQEMVEAVNQGFPVCAYSGELPAWQFKDWIYQQAAGPDNTTPILDPLSNCTEFDLNFGVESRIDQWMKGKFFLYDNRISSAHDADSIMRVFEYAVRRYSCCVFMVDNLMTTRFKGSEKEFYRNQSLFAARLADFAKKYEVVVHLVAHPRKGDASGSDDVSGSGDITNLADNVFCVKRLTEEQVAQEGYGAMLQVWKNRKRGKQGLKIKLDYDERSRRFYRPENFEMLHKRYRW